MSGANPPVTLCISLDAKTAGQSCGQNYPNKTHEGLCAGCATLSGLAGADFDTARMYPRCVDCGAMYRGMAFERNGNPLCPMCANASSGSALTPAAQQQQKSRVDRMLAIHCPSATVLEKLKNRVGHSASQAQPVSSSSMHIGMDVFIGGANTNKAKITSSGNMVEKFNIDASIEDDVLNYYLKTFGHSWELRHEHSLNISDIKLRFHGGGRVSCINECLTIDDLIAELSKSSSVADSLPPHMNIYKKRHGMWPAFMYFELHVQGDLFTARTGEEVNMGTKTSSAAKRKSVAKTLESKRLKMDLQNEPVISRFVPRPSAVTAPAARRTVVDLVYLTAKAHPDSGVVRVDQESRSESDSPTYIHDAAFAKGLMKTVYRLETPSGNYVAKRFHQSGADGAAVSVDENDTLICQEVELLGEVKLALEDFYARAEVPSTHCDVAKTLDVTEAKVAYEFVPKDGKPSPASNLPEDTPLDEYEGGITFLVEPFRSGNCTKYVGTLNHQVGLLSGKLASTVHAFIHFFYKYTQESMVLVDVQTMRARVDGETKNVIFDPMVHSTNGTNGPGDHGQKGIDDFLKTHSCNSMCRELKLKGLSVADSDTHAIILRDSYTFLISLFTLLQIITAHCKELKRNNGVLRKGLE
ncbi:kinase-like domain-containing protein [Mycena amicta]|nr:kinase-like domain-containing protein [Mycena amicta]